MITRQLVERLSGPDDLAIPEIATERDLRILEKIASRLPWLGAANGWNVHFGRELNATDDRGAFVPFTGSAGARPVLEGKQIEPFRVAISTCRYELADGGDGARVPRRARLAYRDIASATNRLTLIAAIVPPRAVTTHTLFCLKTPLPVDAQHVLVRAAQQLRRELPDTDARQHPRHRCAGLTAPGARSFANATSHSPRSFACPVRWRPRSTGRRDAGVCRTPGGRGATLQADERRVRTRPVDVSADSARRGTSTSTLSDCT